MQLPDGTIIAQDYDGLAGVRSDAAALACDPDKVLYELTEDGDEVLPRDERGQPVEIYPGRSKTVQADKDSTDINLIVARFEKQGIAPLVNREGAYLDVSEVPDFRGALEQVRIAREYFDLLPAKSRAIFRNDPAEFMDAVKDDVRLEDLIKAGVVKESEVIDTTPVVPPVVPAPVVP